MDAGETGAPVAVIGAGLAGSEAALTLARMGVAVELYEMRPTQMTPAHRTGLPAELVCSNSLKSTSPAAAHGLLKQEMYLLNSPLLDIARRHALPAGSALAVDREPFSRAVLEALERESRIKIVRKECDRPPEQRPLCIIAAGPLVSPALTSWLAETFPSESLYFYDAIAPVVDTVSIDMSVAFAASRHDPLTCDYINCPFSKQEYETFHRELVAADEVVAREFENARYFEACLPVEVIARRGELALAFGTLRPVGLTDPRTGRRPYAVCQLRRENAAGTAYGLVGFQTRLRVPEQQRVFRLIPGLQQAEFLQYGSIHRNTYIDSPRLLAHDFSFRDRSGLFVAGQLCGGEGYTESIGTGHLVALAVCARLRGTVFHMPPPETMCGALAAHVTEATVRPFTPSNVHFGLLAPIAHDTHGRGGKRARKEAMSERALESMRRWVDDIARPLELNR